MGLESEESCVIIGASHGGSQVATRLRRSGWQGRIRLIGDEPYLPYHRPPLSKDYLKGVKSKESMLLLGEAAYEKQRIGLSLGTRVDRIDQTSQTVTLEDGEQLGYSKLVLAVGARPTTLALPGADLGGVCYLRTADDVDQIRDRAKQGARAVVIGGGYIGLEVAASLRSLDLEVTVLEALDRVLQRVTSEEVSQFFTRVHTEEGVDIRVRSQAKAICGTGVVSGVELDSGEFIAAEIVVIGIGVTPNTELAKEAGLNVSDGIEVDEFARTSNKDIYAVGDCACFFHPTYRRRLRLESVQNANDQAVAAVRSILGEPEPYDPVPWFWSDQFDVKLQIAGLALDPDLVVTRVSQDTKRSMSVLYLRQGRLLAVDAMNKPKDFIMGKKLIREQTELNLARLADNELPLTEAVS